jgi:hypothetical protein
MQRLGAGGRCQKTGKETGGGREEAGERDRRQESGDRAQGNSAETNCRRRVMDVVVHVRTARLITRTGA